MGTAIDRIIKLARVDVNAHLRMNKGGKVSKVKAYSYFLGHDGSGTEINVGGRARIIGGPDKGESGTILGAASGGSIQIELGFGMQKRKVLATPEELKVTAQPPKGKRDDLGLKKPKPGTDNYGKA